VGGDPAADIYLSAASGKTLKIMIQL